MKTIIMSIFLSGLLTYAHSVPACAQGKGGGHVSGGPGDSGQNQHGKSTDHQGTESKNDQAFESRIESNPQLRSRLESLLPAGMDLKTAAMGFRNQGQFIAALHVSKNLNIPFDQLKAKMTGNPPVSLGKAIKELRPNLTDKQADTEADTAEKQAKLTEKGKPIS